MRSLPPIAAATALALLGSGLDAAHAGSTIFSPDVRQRMVVDALKVSPPSLARLLIRHADLLRAGVAAADAGEGGAAHRQDGLAPEGTAAALGGAISRAVQALDGHAPMGDVAWFFGVVAHAAADLNDPLLVVPAGAAATFADDYARYIERNLRHYRVVFYGHPEGGWDPLGSARIARDYFPHLDRAYAAAPAGSSSFDVRSIPFGIGAICYSRAVTDVARAWLDAWRQAGGDISGTPHLKDAPPLQVAASAVDGAVQDPGREVAVEISAPRAGKGGEPAPPDETIDRPATKVIMGKARRGKWKRAAGDPNQPAPADGEEP